MDHIPETPGENANVLDDVEYILYQANGWKRLANYITDRMAYYFLWQMVTASFGLQMVHYLFLIFHDRTIVLFIWYCLSAVTFVLVIAGVEASTGGKTLGKLLTGTRAVNDDGTRITAKTALLRCLSRLVPFEAFSAIGDPSYPWHDRWTHTVVIDERLTTILPQDLPRQ